MILKFPSLAPRTQHCILFLALPPRSFLDLPLPDCSIAISKDSAVIPQAFLHCFLFFRSHSPQGFLLSPPVQGGTSNSLFHPDSVSPTGLTFSAPSNHFPSITPWSPRFTVLKSDFLVLVNIINIIQAGQILNPKIISTPDVYVVTLTHKILPFAFLLILTFITTRAQLSSHS